MYTEKMQVTYVNGIRGTTILFCGGVVKFFFTEIPILKQDIVPCLIFLAQYSERYCKSFCCEPLDAEHPKRYDNHFFNP